MNSKKRKERKQMITLGIAAAVIIALVVVYAMISNGFDGNDEESETTLEPMDIGTFTIIEENYSMMTKLSYTYNDKTIDLEVVNSEWALAEDHDYPLDMEKVMLMTQAISDYGGYRRLAYNEANMSAYGFDDPLYDITATYYESDGEKTYSRRYLIGDKNELTGYYYFYEDGSDYIYMVTNALFEYFGYTKSELFAVDDVPAPELEDISAMTVTKKGEDPVSLEIPEAAAEENEDGTINYSPVELIMDTLMFDVKLKYKNHVDYAVSEAKLAEYGLVAPELTIKLDYTKYTTVSTEDGTSGAEISLDDTFTIMFGAKTTVTETDDEGNETENEVVYVTVDESDIVYTVDADHYTEILVALGEK